MNCPKCNNKAPIVETRRADNKVIRVHFCKKCFSEFMTVENYISGLAAETLLREGRLNAKRKTS